LQFFITLNCRKSYNDFYCCHCCFQISVIDFASLPKVAIPIKPFQGQQEVLDRVAGIEFSGGNAKIYAAIDLGLSELNRLRRSNATQVIILLSDGHGEEYWSSVQETSKRLRDAKVETFAVTSSEDYNLGNLVPYAGDKSRVFANTKQTNFINTITTLLNNCLKSDLKGPPGSVTTPIKLPTLPLVAPEPTEDVRSENIIISSTPSTESPDTSTTNEISTTEQVLTTSESTTETFVGTPDLAEEIDVFGIIATQGIIASEDFSTSSDNLASTEQQMPTFAEETKKTESHTTEIVARVEKELNKQATEAPELWTEKEGSTSVEKESTANESLEATTAITEKTNSSTEDNVKKPTTVTKKKQCDVDVVFVIDRSAGSTPLFDKQISFATSLVDKLLSNSANLKRLQIGAISFASEAQVDLEFGLDREAKIIDKEILAINQTVDETSLVSGISLAIKVPFAQSTRRPNAELVMFLISDGKSQEDLQVIAKQTGSATLLILHTLPKGHFYAASFNDDNKAIDLEKLALFASSKHHVFIDRPSSPFVNKAVWLHEVQNKDDINNCVWGTDEGTEVATKKPTEYKSAEKTPLDLVILLDQTAPKADHFTKSKTAVIELLQSLEPKVFNSYVNTALVTFNDEPELITSLKVQTPQSGLVKIIDELEQKLEVSSVAKGYSLLLRNLVIFKTPQLQIINIKTPNFGNFL
uniref:VWFA domain-containing protein n=1 Tax=Enterobius vermicularis TaxID=51028 RepID=A0A0N4UZ93_ENTVE